IAFEGVRWYQPRYLWPLLLVALVAMAWLLVDTEYHYQLALQLGVFLAGLFVGCLFCHGELYRTRPAPAHLTAFYLTVSAGCASRSMASRATMRTYGAWCTARSCTASNT